MKIYVLPDPNGLVRSNDRLTLAYRVRLDDSTDVSLDREVVATGDRATIEELKALAFMDARRFEEAIAAAAALSAWIGAGRTVAVPDSTIKIRFDAIVRTPNESSLTVTYAILDAGDAVIAGPDDRVLSSEKHWTRDGLKREAFPYARGVEVAKSTFDSASGAQGTEVTVQ